MSYNPLIEATPANHLQSLIERFSVEELEQAKAETERSLSGLAQDTCLRLLNSALAWKMAFQSQQMRLF